MQELILVISRCISGRKKSNDEQKSFYCFHFKGYYAGDKIKLIHLYPKSDALPEQLTKGDDYLLWVKKKRIYQEILEVELIRHKKII